MISKKSVLESLAWGLQGKEVNISIAAIDNIVKEEPPLDNNGGGVQSGTGAGTAASICGSACSSCKPAVGPNHPPSRLYGSLSSPMLHLQPIKYLTCFAAQTLAGILGSPVGTDLQ